MALEVQKPVEGVSQSASQTEVKTTEVKPEPVDTATLLARLGDLNQIGGTTIHGFGGGSQ
jgi:hypothetical protein